ncbi:helicase-related protein [Clostridiaceae bacterium HSG29]|nr:helicase-related protein [Clostridiaceae bacterium HSG29]
MDKLKAREIIVDELKREVLGPGSEKFTFDDNKEIIWESPAKRYLTGILHQRETVISGMNDEINEEIDIHDLDSSDIEVQDKTKGKSIDYDLNMDEEIALSNQFKPSSMGMTFFCKGDIEKFYVNFSFARYKLAEYSDIKTIFDETIYNKIKQFIPLDLFGYSDGYIYFKKNYIAKNRNQGISIDDKIKEIDESSYYLLNKMIYSKNAYKRMPYDFFVELNFDGQKFVKKNIFDNLGNDENPILVEIFAKKKYLNDYDVTSITIIAINQKIGSKIIDKLFQSKFTLLSTKNNFEISKYIDNPNVRKYESDEDKNLKLLFRNKKKYAVGHGTSVFYKVKDINDWIIATCYLPSYEVENMNFEIDGIDDEMLSMENYSSISNLENSKILEMLDKFIEKYSIWIKENHQKRSQIEDIYHSSFDENIAKTIELRNRMIKSLQILKNDNNVMTAFKYANFAMLMQRIQVNEIRAGLFTGRNSSTKLSYSGYSKKNAKWRSFQLAFLLLSIESIVNLNSEYRDIVDLIWVPTGGGKTEAYLGLSAFTIFYRRLRYPNNGCGTTIIMRYTLRLLAAQQFNRASVLICACEIIRRDNETLFGTEPITIGLWIGSSVTPNSNKNAVEEYKKLTSGKRSGKYNDDEYKFQVLICPWCGTPLTRKGGSDSYGLRKDKKTIFLHCLNENCDFEKRLPIRIIDEDIYNYPPTLLFATVDKFAQLPWKGEASALLGVGNSMNKAPELIIQDELHLITGPLGTIVALYEHAINMIISKKGIKPKIIASTATIKNAEEQVKNLYNRKICQFPQPISQIEDSFFVKSEKEKYGRKYVGVIGTGITQTTVEIKVIGKLLQTVINLDTNEDVIDAYYTLIGYFNSIRELGKCTTLVNDDIKDFMRRLRKRTGEKLRILINSDELTSRLKSSEIIETLEKLEIKFKSKIFENKLYSNYPSDIVLATNMISVGVDVGRLNGMVVIGQPKLTSEYIQASSRVGRSDPGYVITIFDSAKARDRSHYENYQSYHEAFYYYVEPTSVTPFSEAAIDRAIHGVIVTLIRHYYDKLNSEDTAMYFQKNSSYVDEIKTKFLNIVRDIDIDMVDVVEDKIDRFMEFWESKIKNIGENEILMYGKENKNRIIMPFKRSTEEDAWETLQAMRNVDSESKVFIP